MRQVNTIGTPMGHVLAYGLDGLAPFRVRIRPDRRPSLPLRRVTFGEQLTQVTIGHALTNVGTLRRLLPL
jgi:hypothetical protein